MLNPLQLAILEKQLQRLSLFSSTPLIRTVSAIKRFVFGLVLNDYYTLCLLNNKNSLINLFELQKYIKILVKTIRK